ncbi:hypothetical protein [Streptomyces sp. N35]|uniref:hypothetical protein n=1 Tax=Streptomyces sp. N35 TaxID=2795730 RepID=UPI001F17E657|nr:hypothetical protein [Streptomyces sp. N35]
MSTSSTSSTGSTGSTGIKSIKSTKSTKSTKNVSTSALTESECGTGPRAHCVAEADGGLAFELGLSGAEGGQAVLLLRRRRGQATDEARLPLAQVSPGRLRAELPVGTGLREGRWDAYLVLGEDAPVRMLPGMNDLRALLGRVPGKGEDLLRVRIPYPTKDGHLAVRAWQRSPHVEAGELYIREDRLTFQGRLFGAEFDDGAYLEADPRGSDEPSLRAEVVVDGDEFTATVPYRMLMPGLWDLRLGASGARGARGRGGGLPDGIAPKEARFTHPALRVSGEYGPVDAEPYYTVDNDLSVKVTARADESEGN